MTKRICHLITSLVFVGCLTGAGWAQSSQATDLTQLRERILKLEASARGQSVPIEVRKVNNQLLRNLRVKLSKMLRREIEGLKNYLKIVRSIPPDEKKRLTDRISEMEKERQAVDAALNAPTATIPGSEATKPDEETKMKDDRPIEPMRIVLGFEQVGFASANISQRAFLDFFFTSPPLVSSKEKECPMWCLRLWGNIRFSGLPKENLNVGGGTDMKGNGAQIPIKAFSLSSANDFFNSVATGDLKDITHSVELLFGPEFRLMDKKHISVGVIAPVGIITPISPSDSLSFFDVPADVATLYPQANRLHLFKGETVAFVAPDRDQLLKQYYAGFRVRTDFKEDDKPDAVFDITFGQNEAVTGGHPRGGVMRLEGFYPLQVADRQFIYLFGTAILKMSRPNIIDPVILKPVEARPLPDSKVHLITTEANRDIYRFGIGVDLLKLLKKDQTVPKNEQAPTQ
jgi:hypothetical protein